MCVLLQDRKRLSNGAPDEDDDDEASADASDGAPTHKRPRTTEEVKGGKGGRDAIDESRSRK
jgi:hypothetical protein